MIKVYLYIMKLIVSIFVTLLAAVIVKGQNSPINFTVAGLTGTTASKSMTVEGLTMTASTTFDWDKGTGGPNLAIKDSDCFRAQAAWNKYTITLMFDQDVSLDSYHFDSWGSGVDYSDNAFSFDFDGKTIATVSLAPFGVITGSFTAQEKAVIIPANAILTIVYENPDQIGGPDEWLGLTVTTVPEPSSYALIFCGIALLSVARRKLH